MTKPKVNSAAAAKPTVKIQPGNPSRYKATKNPKNTRAEPVSGWSMIKATGTRKNAMAWSRKGQVFSPDPNGAMNAAKASAVPNFDNSEG
ncbi:MAG: hypothetical protein KatS3mg029_0595 [Saprospiraceae bacterium]|nr:MAG: hypothetical protein KatS3mg029_0595 [Saprospiraceae bacterium]